MAAATPSPVEGSAWARLGLSALWVGSIVAVLWTLHQLGRGQLSTPPLLDRSELSDWLAERDALTVAFASLRLVALILAWYLLATTALGLAARASRLPGLVRLADLGTLPAVRRVLGGIAGLGLTASAATLIVSSTSATHRPAVVEAERADELAAQGTVILERLPDGGTLVLERLPDRGTATMRVVGPADAADSAPTPTWTTQAGDHLWHIAEATLGQAWGRPPTDTEIVPYWRQLIEQNRPLLVDRDNPDLIYPGQVFQLPPAPSPPA